MGFFSKKKDPRSADLQVPDESALRAAAEAEAGNHARALDSYGTAIDKIHTMCVVAQRGSRIRQPGAQDQPILDGFVSSLAAVLSAEPQADASATVQTAINYLNEIAGEAGPEAARYRSAMESIQSTYQAARSTRQPRVLRKRATVGVPISRSVGLSGRPEILKENRLMEPTAKAESDELADDIARLVEGQDELLDKALGRIRREADEGIRAFFKHGDHGSHNSG